MVRQVTAEGFETWTHVRSGETMPAWLQMGESMGYEARTSRRNVLRLSGVAVEKVDEVTERVNALVEGQRLMHRVVGALQDEVPRVSRGLDQLRERLPPAGWWARVRWLIRG